MRSDNGILLTAKHEKEMKEEIQGESSGYPIVFQACTEDMPAHKLTHTNQIKLG